MALKRINVYVDDDDLTMIKEAAVRTGVSEAEVVREGIHRMALATRVWDEPFVTDGETFDLGRPVTIPMPQLTPDALRAAVARIAPSRIPALTEYLACQSAP